MTVLQTPQLTFSLDDAIDFGRACARKLEVCADSIRGWSFFKKSLDVRHKQPKFMATLHIDVVEEGMVVERLLEKGCIHPLPKVVLPQKNISGTSRVAVIGAGPSGLFAAWTLALSGVKVDIYERGKSVDCRGRDVAELMHKGILQKESNICFGEGGAGTYSDGKLMTRTKSQYIPIVLDLFAKCGADERILFEAHPHIGTDKLTPMLRRMRHALEERGVSYHFETRLEDLWIQNGRCRGIVINGDAIGYDSVFLCMGHSADETIETLFARGIAMEAKPLAIGVRVEHPQALIDRIQYGRYAGHPLLPPAEYAVRYNPSQPNRPSVFSFCMCPGGRVVPSQTCDDCRVVNGMSGSFRNGKYANSALVVQVGNESFDSDPLGGLHWIRRIEKKAAENCPNAYAPAQSMVDFLADKTPQKSPKTTYSPGTVGVNLHRVLPSRVCRALCEAIPAFDRQMKGFLTQNANLIGVETRTSSPVRILRDKNYVALGVEGLYPLGEGAGYAGGITSCALDGIHAALAWLERF